MRADVLLLTITTLAAGRNLFKYVEPPAPKEKVVVHRRETAGEDARHHMGSEVAPAAAPALPAFSWRYIGRFGPAESQLAAFVREGEVIVVREGGSIDSTFSLRRIGIESVIISIANSDKTLTIQP